VKPARVVESPKIFQYWLTPVSKKLLADGKRLRFGTEEQQTANNLKPRRADGRAQFLTNEQRSTPEWEAEVRIFLKQMEDWRSHHDEDAASFFHMSAINYGALIELIPTPRLRSSILRSYVTFLAQSEMRLKSPPEWFTYVDRIVRTFPPHSPFASASFSGFTSRIVTFAPTPPTYAASRSEDLRLTLTEPVAASAPASVAAPSLTPVAFVESDPNAELAELLLTHELY
jgi:hypothetical protein